MNIFVYPQKNSQHYIVAVLQVHLKMNSFDKMYTDTEENTIVIDNYRLHPKTIGYHNQLQIQIYFLPVAIRFSSKVAENV